MAFLSHSFYDMPRVAPRTDDFILMATRLSNHLIKHAKERLELLLKKFNGRHGNLFKQHEALLSRISKNLDSEAWPNTKTPIDQIFNQFNFLY